MTRKEIVYLQVVARNGLPLLRYELIKFRNSIHQRRCCLIKAPVNQSIPVKLSSSHCSQRRAAFSPNELLTTAALSPGQPRIRTWV